MAVNPAYIARMLLRRLFYAGIDDYLFNSILYNNKIDGIR